MRQKDGFRGETSVVLPKMITDIMESDPYMRQLYITDIGFYPHAANHYRERLQPIVQHILIVCIDGKGWVKIDDTTYTVSANSCFVIPAGVSHSYGADSHTPWTIYWTHFNGSVADTIVDALKGKSRPLNPTASTPSAMGHAALFESIISLLTSDMSVDNMRYVSSIFHHYIGNLRYLSAGETNQRQSETERESETVDRLIRYIGDNIDRHLTLADLARFSGYSPSHLSAMFSARMGISPINYSNIVKVRHACHLLDTTPLRLNQICFRIGISDPYYFSRFFSKIMGISPRDYRRRPRP